MPIWAGDAALRATIITSADKNQEIARLILMLIRIKVSLFFASQLITLRGDRGGV
jgi:hypothetical protein